jgi:hypothetical protein
VIYMTCMVRRHCRFSFLRGCPFMQH